MNKKFQKRGVWILFFMVVTILSIGVPTKAKAAVKLSSSAVNLCVGDTKKLSLNGTTKKVTWKSTDPSVVRVTAKGKLTAKKAGSATITATANKKTYKCDVKVNKTFRVDATSITIKKNKTINAYLSVNGAVNATIANKKICSVNFGAWEGDNLSLTIVPKKVGTTTITFTNSVNKEYCKLKVKVTALPSIASFQNAQISTGANSIVVGENIFSSTFQLNRKSTTTVFRVYDEDGSVVKKIALGAVAAKKDVIVSWDGRDEKGLPLSGDFTYAITADGNRTMGGAVSSLGVSPFGAGDGSQSKPFLVSNLAELYLMRDYGGSYFAQDADIDFNSGTYTSLFDDKSPFTGCFDGSFGGKSYQMKNLLGYSSIFGSIGTEGIVKNVTLSKCVINTAGSLLATKNDGIIENCNVSGSVLCNSGSEAAMLVLYNTGLIRKCSVSGTLRVSQSGVATSATVKAGGIALNNAGSIVECVSSANVTGELQLSSYVEANSYVVYAGGIVAENAASGFVTQSTFTGSVQSQIVMPDAYKEVTTALTSYLGYVAGENKGYIGQCVNAGTTKELAAQGTGNGMVQ